MIPVKPVWCVQRKIGWYLVISRVGEYEYSTFVDSYTYLTSQDRTLLVIDCIEKNYFFMKQEDDL